MNKPTWSAGYVADAPYTLGFYREMTPDHLAFVAAINGYAPPAMQGLRYCELGCGRGYGTLLMAAANPDRHFIGVDFNPAHIQEANALAERAGITNIRFVEASFADIAESNDPDLTDFDMVGMHGIISWVNQEVQDDIVRVLRRHLKPGGLVYVSYNAMPGWVQTMPLQRLIREVARRTPGDSIRGFEAARGVVKTLDETNIGFFRANPAARSRIARFDQHSAQYLVHEYMNENWRPFYVTEVMEIMAEAKLGYVGLASVLNNRLAFNMPEAMMSVYNSAPDLGLRELLKDYIANRQFRRDVYVKGGVRPGKQELERLYESMCVIKLVDPPADREEWQIPIGTARPKAGAVAAVTEAASGGPIRLGDLRAECEKKGVAWADLPGIIEILLDAGVLHVARADAASVDPEPSRRFNRMVLELAKGEDTHRWLASPVLGSGISSTYVDRLLGGMLLGESPEEPLTAATVLAELERLGKRVTEQGNALDDPAAAQQKLAGMLDAVRQKVLPAWKRLGIEA